MNLNTLSQSVRRFRKRYVRSVGSVIWESRLRREIDRARRKSREDLPLPDFLIIGAPKCATSWLQVALNQHPQIRMVSDEIEYFSSHVDRPLQWYLDHFAGLLRQEGAEASAAGERIVLGEKSAGYCGIAPARIKLVHRLLPDARLILMIRDPVSRHWSHAKRYFSKEKSQNKGYQSLESREKLYEFFRRTRRFGEFSKIIENWTKVFPPERLLVINQEEAFANPVGIFERALHHINVPGDARMKMKRVARNTKNSGPVVPMPEDVKAYLETMFAEERQSLAKVLKKYSGPEPAESGAAQAGPSA